MNKLNLGGYPKNSGPNNPSVNDSNPERRWGEKIPNPEQQGWGE